MCTERAAGRRARERTMGASVDKGDDLVRHHIHVLLVVLAILGEALLLVAVRAVHLRGAGKRRDAQAAKGGGQGWRVMAEARTSRMVRKTG